MTTQTEAHTVIKTAVKTSIVWPGVAPLIVFENTGPRTEPEYIEVVINHFSSRQRSMGVVGNRSWTKTGDVELTLYTPTGGGTTRELAWADAIETGLEGVNVGGVLFRECTPAESGIRGAWRFLVMRVGFNYYAHK